MKPLNDKQFSALTKNNRFVFHWKLRHSCFSLSSAPLISFLLFLMKVSMPPLSHIGSDSLCDMIEGVMTTKKRSENGEKWAAGAVWKEYFLWWVTDKTDAFSYCSSVPCPTCCLCTLFLPVEGQGTAVLCCALPGGKMIMFWNGFQVNSWLCLYGKIYNPGSK